MQRLTTVESDSTKTRYQCTFVVQAKMDGLEHKLKAELKPVFKGFWNSEVVGYRWDGKELAQVLNSDTTLKKLLHLMEIELTRLHSGALRNVSFVTVKPDKKHQCVRISQTSNPHSTSPVSEFPTIETFEAYDRIAHHVRRIANTLPNPQKQ